MFPASRGLLPWCWNLLDALYNSPSSGPWCLKHKFHRFDLADPFIMNHTHIDNTFSSNSIEGGTTPKLKNAPSILSPPCSIFLGFVYHHYTHKDKTFSSVEGATTPTLKNAPSILSPVYHHTHIDNTFSSIEGATTPKLKNALSILSCPCSFLQCLSTIMIAI